MKNFIFLVTTAFIVSIDSFLAGFSLSKKPNHKMVIAGAVSIIFVLCVVANYLGAVLKNVLTENVASLGGSILVLIGVYDLIAIKKSQKERDSAIIESVVTGFCVGLDGALSNLSLSIMGMNAFYVPVVITLMHLLMISLGLFTSNTCLKKFTERYSFIPPATLIVLGIYKLLPVIFVFLA